MEEAGGRDGLGADPRRHSARCAPVQTPVAFSISRCFFCEFGSINGLVNVLLLRFAGTQKYYIFAAGTYKVGRKGAPLDLTPLCVSYAVPCS